MYTMASAERFFLWVTTLLAQLIRPCVVHVVEAARRRRRQSCRDQPEV